MKVHSTDKEIYVEWTKWDTVKDWGGKILFFLVVALVVLIPVAFITCVWAMPSVSLDAKMICTALMIFGFNIGGKSKHE